jgi:hypothetical protein
MYAFTVAEGPPWTQNRITHKLKGFSAKMRAKLAQQGTPDRDDRTVVHLRRLIALDRDDRTVVHLRRRSSAQEAPHSMRNIEFWDLS